MQRPLLLNGFMATGKSTVGRLVAARLERPFVDLDERIEAVAGSDIATLFAREGEAAFRQRERKILEALLDAPPGPAPVVALGGGALVDRETRLAALDRAVVITLSASPQEIARRHGKSQTRPLLQGNVESRASELLEARRVAYAEAHATLSTEARDPELIASEVEAIWRRDPIAVAAGERSYAVQIGRGILDPGLAPAVGHPSRVVLVSDETVHGLYGARVEALLQGLGLGRVVLTPGEEHKRIESVEAIWRAALGQGADRRSCLVALGGGVVTDITGFAAATYMRGVRWVGVPTTLLAMVDASVGGKTGVDLLEAKNAVGAFHQPSSVLCDVDLLRTEELRAFRSALAEVVKTALIGDGALLDRLEAEASRLEARDPDLLTELVRRSIRVKARIVSQDERESGLRAVLNLGHTLGHALEAQGGYSRLTHGEAVSLGLCAALGIGEKLGETPPELGARVTALLCRLGLPTDLSGEPLAQATSLIGHDKKRAGTELGFVVARAPGQVEIRKLPLADLEKLSLSLI